MSTRTRADRRRHLLEAAEARILVLDGAMGTMIQAAKPTPDDYRGDRFRDWPIDPTGNNDLLTLTRPDLIQLIHEAYYRAGADFAATNTFSSTTVAQADYGMEDLAYELNEDGARLACRARDAVEAEQPDRVLWVAGAIGPTNRTASISPDVNNPGARNIDFDTLKEAYGQAVRGLIAGGVDVLMVETIFDTLNAKACLFAIDEVFEARGETLPVIISGTITDLSGRTLSGQTAEAFWISVRHAKPFAIGLNCALGAEQMRPFLADLSRVADARVSVYPNAGLPNAFGGYDETPEMTSGHLGAWARDGLVNIVGGCCGTTPAHIQAIRDAVQGVAPRAIPDRPRGLYLSGLEPFELVG